MVKRDKVKKYFKFFALSIGTGAAVAAVTALPAYSAQGVKNGLIICAQTVIPSLFPFCVLSSFFVKSGLCSIIGRAAAPVTRLAFRQPGEAGAVIIMGLCGGFPVGAAMAASLFEGGALSCEQAGRLMLFCVNAGPAFVIGAVGAGMLGSTRAGTLIFVSLSAASLIVGALTRFIPEEEERGRACQAHAQMSPAPLREALPLAVAQGSAAVFSICAWVTVFSCALEYLPLAGFTVESEILLGCVFEATRGCKGAVALGNIPVIAAALGWGGLSVHCQIMRHVRAAGVPAARFICARVLNAALSALICSGLLKVFPCSVQTFASGMSAVPAAFSVSAPAAAAMLFMGALLILELDTKRERC